MFDPPLPLQFFSSWSPGESLNTGFSELKARTVKEHRGDLCFPTRPIIHTGQRPCGCPEQTGMGVLVTALRCGGEIILTKHMHVIYTMLDDRVRYWNTCGWTQNLNKARVYTYADAKEAQSRMLADRLRVTIAPVKKT